MDLDLDLGNKRGSVRELAFRSGWIERERHMRVAINMLTIRRALIMLGIVKYTCCLIFFFFFFNFGFPMYICLLFLPWKPILFSIWNLDDIVRQSTKCGGHFNWCST